LRALNFARSPSPVRCRTAKQPLQALFFRAGDLSPHPWAEAFEAQRCVSIHQVDGVTNQPEGGKTHSCGHPSHLAVATFAKFKAKPAGWNRATLPNRWIAITDRLFLVIRQEPCFGGPG
jgi:hypothetical protein